MRVNLEVGKRRFEFTMFLLLISCSGFEGKRISVLGVVHPIGLHNFLSNLIIQSSDMSQFSLTSCNFYSLFAFPSPVVNIKSLCGVRTPLIRNFGNGWGEWSG
jgi:hypothetical protein